MYLDYKFSMGKFAHKFSMGKFAKGNNSRKMKKKTTKQLFIQITQDKLKFHQV